MVLTRDGRPLFRAEGGRVAVRGFVASQSGISFDITADATTQVVVTLADGRARHVTVKAGRSRITL